MHYGDEFQQKENFLSVVVYIHDDLTSLGKRDLYLASIRTCKYMRPVFVQMIIESTHDMLMSFEEVKKLESETWYLIDICEKKNSYNYCLSQMYLMSRMNHSGCTNDR